MGLGFQAVATTSSGFAWSNGHADNHVSRDAVLAHLRTIVQATDLPVNAGFENGFGVHPAEVAESVMRAAQSLAQGRFDGFGDAASGAQLNGLFAGDPR